MRQLIYASHFSNHVQRIQPCWHLPIQCPESSSFQRAMYPNPYSITSSPSSPELLQSRTSCIMYNKVFSIELWYWNFQCMISLYFPTQEFCFIYIVPNLLPKKRYRGLCSITNPCQLFQISQIEYYSMVNFPLQSRIHFNVLWLFPDASCRIPRLLGTGSNG